jgi:uncharacterized protein
MLGPGWTEVVALAAACLIAVLAAPAGIAGAVLLLPFQVSILGTPSPAVTPTNLLYNVIATPGALYRYWRQGQTGGRLALVLITGTVPGVITGSVIRVELLPSPQVFDLVAAAVLPPLGTSLITVHRSPPAPSKTVWVVTQLVTQTGRRSGVAAEPARAVAAPASRRCLPGCPAGCRKSKAGYIDIAVSRRQTWMINEDLT